ncbi:MAG: hypothetical protein V1701_05800 [Planctomycetota bacterium]
MNEAKIIDRTPAAIVFRLGNYSAIDPNSKVKGLDHGGKTAEGMFNKYSGDKDELHRLADKIKEGYLIEHEDNKSQLNHERTYKEGAERRFIQTTKERNNSLRKAAIKEYGTVCMVCGFDFNKTYGEDIADGYIEVHHEKMLAGTEGEKETTVDEVKVVCSNCHRIIHRKKEMLDWNILKRKSTSSI